jgi:hypothetical protein
MIEICDHQQTRLSGMYCCSEVHLSIAVEVGGNQRKKFISASPRARLLSEKSAGPAFPHG